MQPQLIEIRDQRQKEWFWIDNEFLDAYAKLVGPVATLVYLSLSRHADQGSQTAFPSMQTIGQEVGVRSRNTIAKGIKKLEQYGIIATKEAIDHRNGKRLNNVYTLLSRNAWKAPGSVIKKAPEQKKIAVKPMTLPHMEVSAFVLPPWVNPEAWAEWETYRKEIKKKLTPTTVKKQIAFLSLHQADHVAIITQSIQNGWTGLFELKGSRTVKQTSQPQAKEGKYAHLTK